ncbi:hypothetical protein NE865_14505 [Phthorimaea operculella]|nr:hypothetical protein NE865_14505 [Phthorimaea operculella]
MRKRPYLHTTPTRSPGSDMVWSYGVTALTNRAKSSTVERQPAYLPYLKEATEEIGRIPKRASIETIFKSQRKISQFIRSVKCNIPLQDPGVYKLDRDCILSYTRDTKRNVSTGRKEHIADVKDLRARQSAVCEHVMDNPTHYVRFDKAAILAKEMRFIPRKVREAIETQKHPKNQADASQIRIHSPSGLYKS